MTTGDKSRFDRILLYVLTLVVLSLAGWMITKEAKGSRTAYVDIGKLLDGYKFKKDLEGAGSRDLLRIKGIVDSLELVHKATLTADGRSAVDTPLAYARNAFEQYYISSNQEISKKIWERLNPLMEEYGKSKGLHLLIGANGQGTVLYGSRDADVTSDLIEFVNRKYEKGQ